MRSRSFHLHLAIGSSSTKKLAIDLGGLHHELTQTVDLDDSATTLGIIKGNVYSLDLFHAERRTDESNFRIETNLDFVNCGSLPPEIK